MKIPEDMQTSNCPVCSAEDNQAMGILGHKVWYRCRACGIDYNKNTQYAFQGDKHKE